MYIIEPIKIGKAICKITFFNSISTPYKIFLNYIIFQRKLKEKELSQL